MEKGKHSGGGREVDIEALRKEAAKIMADLEEISQDPVSIKRAMEIERVLGRIRPEELLRRFDI